MAKAWLLYGGDPYAEQVIGSFATAKHAAEVAAALGGTDPWDVGYRVESVEVLPADVAVEDLGTVYGWRLGWYWDGTVRADEPNEPRRRIHLTGIPEDETDGTLDGEAEEGEPVDRFATVVSVKADETNYTLGAWITIVGLDEQAVKTQADECRAGTQDVAAFVVDCWKLRGEVPGWVWLRDENQGLLDALRAAGIR